MESAVPESGAGEFLTVLLPRRLASPASRPRTPGGCPRRDVRPRCPAPLSDPLGGSCHDTGTRRNADRCGGRADRVDLVLRTPTDGRLSRLGATLAARSRPSTSIASSRLRASRGDRHCRARRALRRPLPFGFRPTCGGAPKRWPPMRVSPSPNSPVRPSRRASRPRGERCCPPNDFEPCGGESNAAVVAARSTRSSTGTCHRYKSALRRLGE
jgi:hypothetical protein